MKAVIQRVKKSSVKVNDKIINQINEGLNILIAIKQDDNEQKATKLAQKILKLRIFEDENGKMNLSILDKRYSILVISQFTLYADTSEGNRPSFTLSASPDKAKRLYDFFIEELKKSGLNIATGIFGAKMEVEIINDGPVTIIMEI
jgi:D-tyrosyl-tRNA(Tyr) deacylase